MNIPIIWLKDYIKTDKGIQQIAESFTALGLMLDKPIQNEVLDLEQRFDRADWLSLLGCARDFAAFENIQMAYPQTHTTPGIQITGSEAIKIQVDCPDLVKRFNTRVFKNIKVGESPEWIKERLKLYGMPSINNIVDITNFVMIEYGQPTHAQDIAKLEKPEIVLRRARNNEQITTLDGTTATLDSTMLVLSQNNKATVIGGIVGGIATSVDSTTKDIVLDAGNYNQTSIRKTSRKLKILNETVSRCDKFLHPELTEQALNRATYLILKYAGGDYYKNFDYYPNPQGQKTMKLALSRIKTLSGMDFSQEQIITILQSLEYRILEQSTSELQLEIPYFRTDIEVMDDIVADILRINDFANIPLQLINAAPPTEITADIYKFEEKLRNTMVALGLDEHITEPLVEGDANNESQVHLENSANAEKTALRTDIYTTLAPIIELYEKHGIQEASLFEIGKIYNVHGDSNKYENYKETRVLCAIYANRGASPLKHATTIKTILYGLLQALNIDSKGIIITNTNGTTANITYNNICIGYLKYNSFSLYTEELQKIPATYTRVIEEITRKATEDITIKIGLTQYFETTAAGIHEATTEILKNPKCNDIQYEVIDEYIDQNNNDQQKAITIRFTFKLNVPAEESISELIQNFKGIILKKV